MVAHVGHAESHVPRQLLLNACVVLDHIGAFIVVVDERRREDTKNVWLVEVPYLIGDGQWKPRVVTVRAGRVVRCGECIAGPSQSSVVQGKAVDEQLGGKISTNPAYGSAPFAVPPRADPMFPMS